MSDFENIFSVKETFILGKQYNRNPEKFFNNKYFFYDENTKTMDAYYNQDFDFKNCVTSMIYNCDIKMFPVKFQQIYNKYEDFLSYAREIKPSIFK